MTTIEIIMLPVTDQQKAKTFYTKLGFQVIVEAPMEHGQTWLQMGLPGQTTSIALVGVQGVVVQTDDIAQKIKELKDKGIEAQR
jgi:catechol 2,3-dioxygenase-like lactoylglutathione lyase family enzyme